MMTNAFTSALFAISDAHEWLTGAEKYRIHDAAVLADMVAETHIGERPVKACPFCGNTEDQCEHEAVDGAWFISCPRCDAQGPTMANEVDAWSAWHCTTVAMVLWDAINIIVDRLQDAITATEANNTEGG